MYDLSLFQALIEQAESSVLTAGGLKNVSKWIQRNTRDPKSANRSWSFKGHEFQIAILDDPSPEQSTLKCAQAGLSEVLIRAALAATAKFSGIHSMYVLPSMSFARKFSASRIDPVIDASPRLKGLLAAGVSNLELKKIGTSFLHIGGASANSSAISVPARALFIDERAFCDEAILSVLASRLGHNSPEERIVRRFSTPLFPGSDIDEDYRGGDMKQYMAYHPACGQWVVLSFFDDVVLPGYDADLRLLEPSDLSRKGVDIEAAWTKCPHCHGQFPLQDLANPDYRAWVPLRPDIKQSSFKVTPYALPAIRTPAVLLKELKDVYKNRVTWQRFGLGEPAESGSDQILRSSLTKAFCLRPVPVSELTGAVIGCDVGKTSHVVIGRAVDERLHILGMEKVRQDSEGALAESLKGWYRESRAQQLVIDAAPDITTPKYLLSQLPDGHVHGCYFVRGSGASDLENYRVDESQGVIKAYRTRVLDWFVEKVNNGKVLFPVGSPYEEEIKEHLMALKRVENRNASGEERVRWISTTSEDHWFFSCVYAAIAWDLSLGVQASSVIEIGSWALGRVKIAA
jgi:hypothetical protein